MFGHMIFVSNAEHMLGEPRLKAVFSMVKRRPLDLYITVSVLEHQKLDASPKFIRKAIVIGECTYRLCDMPEWLVKLNYHPDRRTLDDLIEYLRTRHKGEGKHDAQAKKFYSRSRVYATLFLPI